MKTWIAVPALGLGVAAILAFSTPPGGHRMLASAGCVQSVSVDLTVPEGACLFSSEVDKVSQCKVHAARYAAATAENDEMIWPLGIIELTAGAAVGAWQITIDFVGSLYDFAEEQGGELI